MGVVINTVYGGGSTTKFDLLWTNPSPNASFAAQDISDIDLSPYTLVAVQIRFSQSDTYQMTLQVFMWDDVDTTMRLQFANSNNRGGARSMTYDNTAKEVHFGSGAYNNNTNNNYCVPQKIYGIKF